MQEVQARWSYGDKGVHVHGGGCKSFFVSTSSWWQQQQQEACTHMRWENLGYQILTWLLLLLVTFRIRSECELRLSILSGKYQCPTPDWIKENIGKCDTGNTIGRYGNMGGSGVGLRSRMELHELINKPPFTRKWISTTHQWRKVKSQYQQSRCTKCSKQTHTYCKFCKGRYLFDCFFDVHVLEEERARTTNHWIQLFEFLFVGAYLTCHNCI